MMDNIKEENGVMLQGHIKISNPETGEVIVDKRNAIHYENMSISLAELKNLIYENNEVFEFTTDLRVKLRKGEIEPVPTFKLRKGEIEPVPAFIASDLQVKLKEGEMEPDPAFIEGI